MHITKCTVGCFLWLRAKSTAYTNTNNALNVLKPPTSVCLQCHSRAKRNVLSYWFWFWSSTSIKCWLPLNVTWFLCNLIQDISAAWKYVNIPQLQIQQIRKGSCESLRFEDNIQSVRGFLISCLGLYSIQKPYIQIPNLEDTTLRMRVPKNAEI